MKLTDRAVKSALSPESGQTLLWDDEIKGFGVRITPGSRSFILNYRLSGRERRLTIGAYPAWSVSAARDEAAKLRRRVDAGEDPLEERQSDRNAPTVADLVDRYVAEQLPRRRATTQRDYRDYIKREILPALGKLKVSAVSRSEIDTLHRTIAARAPYFANRVLALLSHLFELAIGWGYRTDNPAKGVEKSLEERRERFLTQEELHRLNDALTSHPNQQSANAVRILLLTGARRGEVLSAVWDQFNLVAGVWLKPSSHTKQKKTHRVPLSVPVVKLLEEMHAISNSPFLFPNDENPNGHLSDIKHFWASICRTAKLEKVRLHDIRHSYASILASAGLSLPVIGALLGHTQPGTTARYAHLADNPLREATERVGEIVSGQRK